MDSPFALPVELTPLANNREQALKRAKSFDMGLKRDPNKQQHTLEFMQKMFDNGHAEIASPVDENIGTYPCSAFTIRRIQIVSEWFLTLQSNFTVRLSTTF